MRFLRSEFSEQLSKAHPEIRWATQTIDDWLTSRNYPELVITGVHRTSNKTKDLYGKQRFSWHHILAAVDFRSHHYKKKQKDALLNYVTSICHHPMWEVLLHDAGTGEHFHLGRRDFAWRKKIEREGLPGDILRVPILDKLPPSDE